MGKVQVLLREIGEDDVDRGRDARGRPSDIELKALGSRSAYQRHDDDDDDGETTGWIAQGEADSIGVMRIQKVERSSVRLQEAELGD